MVRSRGMQGAGVGPDTSNAGTNPTPLACPPESRFHISYTSTGVAGWRMGPKELNFYFYEVPAGLATVQIQVYMGAGASYCLLGWEVRGNPEAQQCSHLFFPPAYTSKRGGGFIRMEEVIDRP